MTERLERVVIRSLPVFAAASLLWTLLNEVADVDPAQYLDVAGWIYRTGDWLHLTDSLGPFINKPPLMMWVQAALMHLIGESDGAAHLASLLFGALMLFSVWAIGRELKDSRRGLIAAALAASSLAFHSMVSDPKVDVVLASMSTVSVWGFVRARAQPGFLWLGWGAAGLAVLSKGPVGLALVGLAIAPEGLRHAWGQSAPGSFLQRVFAVKPVRGLLLVAALCVPFYVAMGASQGSESLIFLLWQQGFGRLLGQSGYANDTTPFFFMHTALWAFAPFIALLVHGLIRRGATLWKTRALPADAARVVLWWWLLPFIVISFADFKLPQYLYWLLAPAALLAAEEVEVLSEKARDWHTRAQWFLGLLFAVGAAVGTWAWQANTATHVFWTVFPPVTWLGMTVLSLRLTGTARWVTATVGVTVGTSLWLHAYFEPALLEYQPGRAWGRVVKRVDPQGTVMPWLHIHPMFSVGFYTGRRQVSSAPAGIRDLVESGESSVALIAKGNYAPLEEVGLEVEPLASFGSFPVSRPTLQFLLPSSRPQTLTWHELVKLRVAK